MFRSKRLHQNTATAMAVTSTAKNGARAHWVSVSPKARVREYWDKSDANPPMIRNREVGVKEVAIYARLARILYFNTDPSGHTQSATGSAS